MPGEKASRLSRLGRSMWEVVKVVLSPLVACLIAYVVSPDFRAWVWQLVGRVGPLVAVAGGLVGIAVAGVVLRGIWGAVRRRVMGWYEGAVWVVSKPVRDELAVRFVAHYGSASGEDDGEEGTALAEVGRKVHGLESDQLLLLELILREHVQGVGPPVVIGPIDIGLALYPLYLGITGEDDDARLAGRLCRSLTAEGLLETWRFDRVERELRIWVAEPFKSAGAAEVALELVRTELFDRDIGDF